MKKLEEYNKLIHEYFKAMQNTEKWYDANISLIKESFKAQYPKATNIRTGYRYKDCVLEVYADFPDNTHKTFVYGNSNWESVHSYKYSES